MHGDVVHVERLTPTLVRVVLGGPGLEGFQPAEGSDAYINIAIPPAGAPYGTVFDPQALREAGVPREQMPARRRYTVRSWDEDARELAVDFVVHGDSGVAGPWAAAAQPGDVLVFEGPASGYRPDPAAAWHLMLGDESALPAIAASLEALQDDATVVVRLVCDGPEHEVPLTAPAGADVRWLHRTGGDERDGALLLDATRALEWADGPVHAFVHGEAEEIRAVRRHLLVDRGMQRSEMSCSPYWRRTMTDEAWRAVKRDFVAAMNADVA
ncbi:siderophore-interacting protein [Quadrisphaera setariae]|uniref:Siderophore-interacting protein n=1 Tax=Quadrisphaera setariae TaxID=2593304 RepID=A0A5C8ZFF4_9ACTN|nr:siderophore-interacting protein [Quadrisphaera setariae]TXR55989.1 siderophore-interacting protein [Quadrisphaera setariae]